MEFKDAYFFLRREGLKKSAASFKMIKEISHPDYEEGEEAVTEGKDICLALVEFHKGNEDMLPIEDIPELTTYAKEVLVDKEMYLGGYPKEVMDGGMMT